MTKTIRTLYIKSITHHWLNIAEHLQKDHGFEPTCWISNKSALEKEAQNRFTGTVILQHKEALHVETPDWFNAKADCSDAKFLRENARHEDIFYNMIDRWSGNVKSISMEKRRTYYTAMADYWFALYQTLDIECVVLPTIPHRLYDYMAYIVAQYLGIPYIMLNKANDMLIDENGNRRGVTTFADDIFDQSKIVRELSNKKRKPSKDLQRYLDTLNQDYESNIPSYMREKQQRKKPISEQIRTHIRNYIPTTIRLPFHVIKHLATKRSFKNTKLVFPYRKHKDQPLVDNQNVIDAIYEHEAVKKRTYDAKQWYEENAVTADLKQKFVYFAPHFQPERSSTPDSDICQWSELMIEIIAGSIPDDWKIYYKEHPSNYREPIMPDNNRSIGHYKNLQALAPQLVFIRMNQDPFSLIDNAQCVATGTGTSSWQAITRGIPSMIFGTSWYEDAPGIERISTIEGAKKFIKKVQNGYKIDFEEITQYLCKFEEVSGDYTWARHKIEYDEEKLKKAPRKGTIKDLSDDINTMYQYIIQDTAKLRKAS